MSKQIDDAKRKFVAACEKQVAGEMKWSAFKFAVEAFNGAVVDLTYPTDPEREELWKWAESTRSKIGVSRYAEFF